jgi:hypothetical protein
MGGPVGGDEARSPDLKHFTLEADREKLIAALEEIYT